MRYSQGYGTTTKYGLLLCHHWSQHSAGTDCGKHEIFSRLWHHNKVWRTVVSSLITAQRWYWLWQTWDILKVMAPQQSMAYCYVNNWSQHSAGTDCGKHEIFSRLWHHNKVWRTVMSPLITEQRWYWLWQTWDILKVMAPQQSMAYCFVITDHSTALVLTVVIPVNTAI